MLRNVSGAAEKAALGATGAAENAVGQSFDTLDKAVTTTGVVTRGTLNAAEKIGVTSINTASNVSEKALKLSEKALDTASGTGVTALGIVDRVFSGVNNVKRSIRCSWCY